MNTIRATGIPDNTPTLTVSGGQGNVAGVTEVHLDFHEPLLNIHLRGWFPLAQLEAALNAARGRRLTEPAATFDTIQLSED